MTIRWMTAFIDRPVDPFDNTVKFWMDATGSKLSETRGALDQFATLVPPGGDAYLRVQRVGDGGGTHLDVHVDDVDVLVERAAKAGALVERSGADPPLVFSPGGLPCCIVQHRGESVRPGPLLSGSGAASLVDQVCIDIPGDRFDEECRFWSTLTGWVTQSSSRHSEFKFLIRPAWSPLRILLQRRQDSVEPTRAHLDLASDDVKLVVADHVKLGAEILEEFDHWMAMRDPAGFAYCVTARSPRTGLLATPVPAYSA